MVTWRCKFGLHRWQATFARHWTGNTVFDGKGHVGRTRLCLNCGRKVRDFVLLSPDDPSAPPRPRTTDRIPRPPMTSGR